MQAAIFSQIEAVIPTALAAGNGAIFQAPDLMSPKGLSGRILETHAKVRGMVANYEEQAVTIKGITDTVTSFNTVLRALPPSAVEDDTEVSTDDLVAIAQLIEHTADSLEQRCGMDGSAFKNLKKGFAPLLRTFRRSGNGDLMTLAADVRDWLNSMSLAFSCLFDLVLALRVLQAHIEFQLPQERIVGPTAKELDQFLASVG